jgi:hypothetical protein
MALIPETHLKQTFMDVTGEIQPQRRRGVPGSTIFRKIVAICPSCGRKSRTIVKYWMKTNYLIVFIILLFACFPLAF